MNKYTAEKYIQLFDKDINQDAEMRSYTKAQRNEKLGSKSVGLYRTKRVAAGDTLELMIYPVWIWQRESSRAKKAKPTEEAQLTQNLKDSKKKLIWKLNANFTAEDIFITLTYQGQQPASLDEAKKDMQAYIRRVKRWRDKQGLPEVKYIYVIEHQEDGRKKRVHHHIIMSGMDRGEAERIWEKGRANAAMLQPDEYGLEGLARYITKGETRCKKQWCCSRNLKPPRITIADHKVTKSDVERMAADEAEVRKRIERREPGYRINDVKIKRSDYVAGAYITVRLQRIIPKGRSPGPGTQKKGRSEQHAIA